MKRINNRYLFLYRDVLGFISIFLILILAIFITTFLHSLFLVLASNMLMIIFVFGVFVEILRITKVQKVGLYQGYCVFVSYYSLKKQFFDSRIYHKNEHLEENKKIIPYYFFDLNRDNILVLKIENSIRLDDILENLNIAPALYGYMVLGKYKSNDQKYMVFELVPEYFVQEQINTFSQFVNYVKTDSYIKIDRNNFVKPGHILITGKTGSGKTISVINLVLQLMIKKSVIEFIDPKNADLSAVAKAGNMKCACEKEDILQILETFRDSMNARKSKMSQLLKSKIGSDYSDFSMTPHYLVIDEVSALQMIMDKNEKNKFNDLLAEIILLGRQLGFFLILSMQQANFKLLPTNIREQISVSIVLGNSGKQTYITAFGDNEDIPARKMKAGCGWIKTDNKSGIYFCMFPAINFDISQAFIECSRADFCQV